MYNSHIHTYIQANINHIQYSSQIHLKEQRWHIQLNPRYNLKFTASPAQLDCFSCITPAHRL